MVLGTCSGPVHALRLVMEVIVLGAPQSRSRWLSMLPAGTGCYPFPWKLVKNNTATRVPKSMQNVPKGSPTEARKVARNHDKTHFVPKYVMCVWHSKHNAILPFSLCHTTTKPQEQGPKSRQFRRCVHLHPQLTNITKNKPYWGPGSWTMSH